AIVRRGRIWPSASSQGPRRRWLSWAMRCSKMPWSSDRSRGRAATGLMGAGGIACSFSGGGVPGLRHRIQVSLLLQPCLDSLSETPLTRAVGLPPVPSTWGTAPRGRSPGLHLAHGSGGQARAHAALAVARGAGQKSPYRWRHGKPTVSPSTIPLVYYHIKGFHQASSVERPLPGGEKRTAGRASH